MSSTAFLGKGLASPLRVDPLTGDFKRVDGVDNVKQCLRDGIFTAFGERPMMERLGTLAQDIVFEDETQVTSLLTPSVQDFVQRFEPRVLLRDVVVEPIRSDRNGLNAFNVRVAYVIRATNTLDNLVFPFYLVANQ